MLSQYVRGSVRLGMSPIARGQFVVPVRGKKKKAKRVEISAEEGEEIDLKGIESNMQKSVDSFRSSLSKIRSGGATAAMLDDVQVQVYGARAALKTVAQVAVKDGRTLSVSVFDEDTTKAVEKGIRQAGLGFNPVVEGNGKMRVPVPTLTTEAREGLAKIAMRDAESARVALRMSRRKALERVRKVEGIGKDEIRRLEGGVEKAVDKFLGEIDGCLKQKVQAIQREG